VPLKRLHLDASKLPNGGLDAVTCDRWRPEQAEVPTPAARRYCSRVTRSTPKLYIFPHAGGSAQYYVPFAKTFSSDVKCVAVQYPGRRGTHDVSSFTSIPDLATEVCQRVSPLDRSEEKRAFFGHSMGALLAFEVACRFEAAGNPIAALFISACAAPGRIGYEYIPDSDRGLLDAVSEMTGANRDFLANEEFAAKILPTLRGLKAIANYECSPDAVVSCPIFAFLGDNDEVATYDKVQSWAQRTTSEFKARVFTGHHFYLNDHLPELVGDIEGQILGLGS
jgi:surfactin synthase thioesterase subunit